MISDDQNQALLTVGNAAARHPAWASYAVYCLEREQGLRKIAFQHLATFLTQTASWSFDQRVEFVRFLFPFFETVESANYGPFPLPLSERLVKPTLLEWCALAPTDARPFRWYGRYYRDQDYLLQALAIDPHDDAARETLLGWWLYSIYYAVHHLPKGYIGTSADNLALGERIHDHIRQLTSSERRAHWTQELEADLELVRNYAAWRASGHPDLVQWGLEHHKRVSYDLGATYYYEV